MKNAFAGILIISMCSGTAWAGSGPAELSCKAKANKKSTLTLKGFIPATEEILKLTLSNGGASIRMTDENADAFTIEAFDKGVFTIVIKRRKIYGEISLYAIPKTVKVRKGPHSTHATFDAVMSAPNPQHKGPVESADDMLQELKMSCSYDYEI